MVRERQLDFGVRNIMSEYTRALEYCKDIEQWINIACHTDMSNGC